MNIQHIALALVCFASFVFSFLPVVNAASVMTFPEQDELPSEDYIDTDIERILYGSVVQKRACIGRSGNCDHRPNDCCQGTTCKCNLWGANCRCQRKGWFQKWGK